MCHSVVDDQLRQAKAVLCNLVGGEHLHAHTRTSLLQVPLVKYCSGGVIRHSADGYSRCAVARCFVADCCVYPSEDMASSHISLALTQVSARSVVRLKITMHDMAHCTWAVVLKRVVGTLPSV